MCHFCHPVCYGQPAVIAYGTVCVNTLCTCRHAYTTVYIVIYVHAGADTNALKRERS